MNLDFKNYLLQITNASDCEEIEIIQSLWSGYGRISRYRLVGSSVKTVVVKFISLNLSGAHPKGWDTDYAHKRKVKSYKIETQWYERWSKRCTPSCRVPEFLGSISGKYDQWIIMEDLNTNYPLRKHLPCMAEIKACLAWLANFHANFLHCEPEGLWPIGTYWHLATRPDEFEKIEHVELKEKAQLIDDLLNNCKYNTLVHGDAKLANFCFSEEGRKIAAVDFQYVGGGCGIKDVAYFIGSCLSSYDCETYQDELLDFYFTALLKAFQSSGSDIDFKALKDEWTTLYPVACADFTRFLLGWMPAHQKINKYNLDMMHTVLSCI